MEVRLSVGLPNEFKHKRPLRSYDTRYLYTGFSRYNVETKTISTITTNNNKLFYKEVKFDGTTFPRAYSAEHVRIDVYSENPKVWSETLNPHDIHFFQQVLAT